MMRSVATCATVLLIAAACAPAAPEAGDSPAELRERVAELERQNAELHAAIDGAPWYWLTLGFIGQVIFGLRFVVQWIATERRRRSVVPVAFWYLSLAGTIVLLAYAIYRVDPVFIAGFSLNMVIYVRNLYFIHRPGEDAPAGATSQSEIRNPKSEIEDGRTPR